MGDELVGRYRIERRLGAGGIGTVHLAHDTLLDRLVALKRITEPSTEGRKRLLREGQLAAKVDHPLVARILDCVEVGDELVLVFEYVEGETLGTRLRREKTLSVTTARHVTRAVLDALVFAHRSSVVHRDVKPDNVMLTASDDPERPGVKLLDFGIGKRLDGLDREQLTETGAAVGTLAFMAPEQASGLAVDARADLYGVGATMFAMIAGRPPVRVMSLVELLRSLCDEEPPSLARLAGVDDDLDAFVRTSLARDPAHRHASASAMRDALDALRPATDDGPTKTAEHAPRVPPVPGPELAPPPNPPSSPPVAANTTARWAIAIGLVVAVIGIGLFVDRHLSSTPRVGDEAGSAANATPPLVPSAAPSSLAAIPDAAPALAVDAGEAAAVLVAPAGDAAVPTPSVSWRVTLSTAAELTPASRRALEGALLTCLTRGDLDATANGFGRLVASVSNAGTIDDPRYIGFDDLPSGPGFDRSLARKNRTRFDDLGQCLARASRGKAVARASDADHPLTATFSP